MGAALQRPPPTQSWGSTAPCPPQGQRGQLPCPDWGPKTWFSAAGHGSVPVTACTSGAGARHKDILGGTQPQVPPGTPLGCPPGEHGEDTAQSHASAPAGPRAPARLRCGDSTGHPSSHPTELSPAPGTWQSLGDLHQPPRPGIRGGGTHQVPLTATRVPCPEPYGAGAQPSPVLQQGRG